MSRQVNFFAATEDVVFFNSWLMTTFPDMTVVFYDSARFEATGGVPQAITGDLLREETVCLVPVWAKDRLSYCPQGSMVSVDLLDSPVLEYSPSVVEEDKECIRIGRIYWAFLGKLDHPEKKQIVAIFRWIQSHSELLPNGRWRIFPHAKRFRRLRQWIGTVSPNPHFNESII